VEILREPQWLNDQIIAFYFQYLESEAYRNFSHDFLFVSPQVTQLLKMIDGRLEDARILLEPLHPHTKQFLFFPVNDNDRDKEGGTHWSLLVYSKIENTFYTFDSANNQNKNATTKIIEVLRRVLNCQLAFSILYPSAQQRNLYDCGIYVICNVENIIKHILRGAGVVRDVAILDRDVVSRKRGEILDLIEALGGKI
jgi:sentrin-specific protease 8